MFRTGLALTLISWMAAGQEVRPQPGQFEVASVRPGDPNGRGQFLLSPAGDLTARNVTLKLLIQQAYDVRDFQIIGGPPWIATGRYLIVAKANRSNEDASNATAQAQVPADLMRSRLQSLLADRFRLAVHRETKELPAYALVVAKSGHKLKPGTDRQGGLVRGANHLTSHGVEMRLLAITLFRQLGRAVLDQTGLSGPYQFELTWTPDIQAGPAPGPDNTAAGPGRDGAPSGAGPSMFTAIQEQLGLRLESTKAPVELIVIDQADRPSEN